MSEIAIASTRNPAPSHPEPSAKPPQLADCTPQEQAELRYTDALHDLLVEACDRGTMETFADALTWTLARITVGYGTSVVAGDILRRLGAHIGELAERRRASEEAEAAREEGRKPH